MLGLAKPHAVIVDVAGDQGGCFETSAATKLPSSFWTVRRVGTADARSVAGVVLAPSLSGEQAPVTFAHDEPRPNERK
jgi:hypothetical protein